MNQLKFLTSIPNESRTHPERTISTKMGGTKQIDIQQIADVKYFV